MQSTRKSANTRLSFDSLANRTEPQATIAAPLWTSAGRSQIRTTARSGRATLPTNRNGRAADRSRGARLSNVWRSSGAALAG
eukprot:13521982-Alexandrium_andersonii.AAC.1